MCVLVIILLIKGQRSPILKRVPPYEPGGWQLSPTSLATCNKFVHDVGRVLK